MQTTDLEAKRPASSAAEAVLLLLLMPAVASCVVLFASGLLALGWP